MFPSVQGAPAAPVRMVPATGATQMKSYRSLKKLSSGTHSSGDVQSPLRPQPRTHVPRVTREAPIITEYVNSAQIKLGLSARHSAPPAAPGVHGDEQWLYEHTPDAHVVESVHAAPIAPIPRGAEQA